jgi:hypothetical protein
VNNLVDLFEKVVNAVHEKAPKTRIAFNASIDTTEEACKRALALPRF